MSCMEHCSPYLDCAVPEIVKAIKSEPADKPAARIRSIIRNWSRTP